MITQKKLLVMKAKSELMLMKVKMERAKQEGRK